MNDNINPFEITKAFDFTDKQIDDYWVELGTSGGLKDIISPSNPMPKYILGSKGSGKTHLMRYFSYNLQKIRHNKNGKDIIYGINEDGYIGIYTLCGGLNSSRFSGKGFTDEYWEPIFEFYMELWLTQLLLQNIEDLFSDNQEFKTSEKNICNEITLLFDIPEIPKINTLNCLIQYLKDLQKNVDYEVNNCAITRKLENITIISTRGKLIFGIPKILATYSKDLMNVQFLYLLDEFENFSNIQQQYINTLVREKQLPTSFRIGSRLYGIKTPKTFSGNEDIIEGSEYEKIFLDNYLRKDDSKYILFAKQLCVRRLICSGYISNVKVHEDLLKSLDSFFENFNEKSFLDNMAKKHKSVDRQYIKSLTEKLEDGLIKRIAPGISNKNDINKIISNLVVENNPFYEKVNTFLLYKDWFSRKNLIESSEEIKIKYLSYSQLSNKGEYSNAIGHFKSDLFAQLFRDFEARQNSFEYYGLNNLISISWGVPRYFLIILKQIFKWALFEGETPFKNNSVISLKSQQRGLLEASKWFYEDARTSGEDGKILQDGISRLATLFREYRFSDKPSECSISTFSINLSQVSNETKRIIQLAEKYSLLIKIDKGRRDKNSKKIDDLYQINRMLAPQWDLPISRRGTLALNPEMANSIFDNYYISNFENLLKKMVTNLNAPDFIKKGTKKKKIITTEDSQNKLPGMDYEW